MKLVRTITLVDLLGCTRSIPVYRRIHRHVER
jgi:hypothetical protein